MRYAGEDIAVGDVLIEAGTALGPRHLGLLASVGRTSARVRPRPRVVIVSTGSELREPGTALAADSIYDGNSFLLAAAARRAGAVADRVGLVPDQPDLLVAALDEQLRRADVIVTSGGISMGDYDVVKEALAPARHRVVRRGRDAARQAAGLRHADGLGRRRRPRGAVLRAPRQPGLVVPLLRGVRAPRPAPDDGAHPGVAHARRRPG